MQKIEIPRNIGSLLEMAAKNYKNKPALYSDTDGKELNYTELNQRVNQYANAFNTEGLKKGDHIAVMLPNCIEFVLILLSIAKIGAVTVPINNRYNSKELAYVLNDSDATYLVIDTIFKDVYLSCKDNVKKIKKVFTKGENIKEIGPCLSDITENASSEPLLAEVSVEDVVTILFTSGTTGYPKGCVHTHEYWLILSQELISGLEINKDDTLLIVAPFYYMIMPMKILACLYTGSKLVFVKKFSPSEYMNLVRKYKITKAITMLPLWIYNQPESPLDKEHNCKILLVSNIPKDIHEPFEKRFNIHLRETYGMTEIGSGIGMPNEVTNMSGSGSVGIPSEIREVIIVDEEGKELPTGEVGELWVSGRGIFKGYYNNQKANSESFDGKWFKTGDLFYKDKNGYYYIVGRKKEMIKRAGDNISANEVEGVLRSHPKIMDAAVVPVPDRDRNEEVKAYILPRSGQNHQTLSPEEIIEFCASRLSEFKLPRYIEYRNNDFSRGPVGKINKKELLKEKENLTEGCYDRLNVSG